MVCEEGGFGVNTLRSNSREEFEPVQVRSLEAINAGSLQRIADAAERMAVNHNNLLSDLRWQKECRERAEQSSKAKDKRIISMKGVITKLRKQLKSLKEQQKCPQN